MGRVTCTKSPHSNVELPRLHSRSQSRKTYKVAQEVDIPYTPRLLYRFTY